MRQRLPSLGSDRPQGAPRSLARDCEGVTLIEFAFVAPVFLLMLMGLFDLGFQVYARAQLQGSVQEAARASTLETGSANSAALDTMVRSRVQQILPNATLTFSRRNYANFEDVAAPEDFTDTNNDDICNNGEVFEDVNGNAAWDADRGADGLGGARDAVLYGVTATYDRVFPFHQMVGLTPQITIDGSTVLRNQPYDEQGAREPVEGTCS